MLDKAVAAAAVKADKTKALDQFNKGQGGFLDRDLYGVLCQCQRRERYLLRRRLLQVNRGSARTAFELAQPRVARDARPPGLTVIWRLCCLDQRDVGDAEQSM